MLENRAPAGGSHNVDQVVGEAHSEDVADPSFLARLTMAGPHRAMMLDRILLSSFVQPMEWDRPLVDTPNPDLEAGHSIIDRWAPFNQRDSSVANMRDLYPTFL